VAITGCGWITPFAAGSIADVLKGLPSRCGFASDSSHYPLSEASLGTLDHLPLEARRERHVLITAVALRHALRSAGLEDSALNSERAGLAIGCALAGQLGMIDFADDVRAQSIRFVSPLRFPQTVGNYVAGAIARACGIRGPSTTLACGTAAGLESIHEGAAWLATGAADLVIAGGAEVFTDQLAQGLKHDELPLADAACVFVLERTSDAQRRGAALLCRVAEGASPSQVRVGPQSRRAESGAVALSTAGFCVPGAVCLELWTGRSLAASGAAAVAGAIAALSGADVPIAEAGATRPSLAAEPMSVVAADTHGVSTSLQVVTR
jgi:3-oxoacyl-(acyl-carrier-protein) synthase